MILEVFQLLEIRIEKKKNSKNHQSSIIFGFQCVAKKMDDKKDD